MVFFVRVRKNKALDGAHQGHVRHRKAVVTSQYRTGDGEEHREGRVPPAQPIEDSADHRPCACKSMPIPMPTPTAFATPPTRFQKEGFFLSATISVCLAVTIAVSFCRSTVQASRFVLSTFAWPRRSIRGK